MYRADFLASKNGISSYQLMRNAGKCIAREIIKKHQKGRVLILCGRGNNGGDGFLVARLLSARGWPVQVGILKSLKKMKDDAIILHPLPRIDEISTDVDNTNQAKYFEQAEYGKYTRAALLSLILNENGF